MNAISKALLLSILIASYFMTYLTFATVKYDCAELLGDEVVVKSGGLSGASLVGGVFPISFIILIYFGFEIYLYKKTKDGFLKKLYLIPLVLILVFIISIFIGGIIANSFQDGIAGGIFMAIIVEIGGVIVLFFSIRIVLQHLLLKFFQKLGYFFGKYFNVIFTVLLIIFVLMTVIFYIDYKLNGKIIGLSRDGLMDCKDDFFNYTSNSRDLMKEKWNEMSYDEQLFLASKFLSNEEQQRWINRNRLVYTSFPEDPNFFVIDTFEEGGDKDTLILENKLFYLKFYFYSKKKNQKMNVSCEELTKDIKNVKTSSTRNYKKIFEWTDQSSGIYYLCAEGSRGVNVSVAGREKGVKIIEKIMDKFLGR